MRSVIRFLAVLPFLMILVAWAPVELPQTDPAKESPRTEESTATSVMLLERLGAVGENQSALAGPQKKSASTTDVTSGEPKEKTAKKCEEEKIRRQE